jgi:hypothetical protein
MSPIGVPGPVWVSRSFCSFRSIGATPGSFLGYVASAGEFAQVLSGLALTLAGTHVL